MLRMPRIASVLAFGAFFTGCQASRMARPSEFADPTLDVPLVKSSTATGTEIAYPPFRIFNVTNQDVRKSGATITVGGFGGGKTERYHEYSFSLADSRQGNKTWFTTCNSSFEEKTNYVMGVNTGDPASQKMECKVEGPSAWTVTLTKPKNGVPAGQLQGKDITLSLQAITKTTTGSETGWPLGYGIRDGSQFIGAAETVDHGHWWEKKDSTGDKQTAAGVLMGVMYFFRDITY